MPPRWASRLDRGRAETAFAPATHARLKFVAETKEQLGGYNIVEAENLDEAISIAAHHPGGGAGRHAIRVVLTLRALPESGHGERPDGLVNT